MTTLTSTQNATLQQLADATRPLGRYQQNPHHALYFHGDSSKVYAPGHGMNGAALRSLVKLGLVEKRVEKFYGNYYRLSDAGQAVLS